jgi:hypothetical protein
MTALSEKKGLIIFIGLLLLVIVVSLAAYKITGDMGIEERFTRAVGLENGEVDEGGAGLSGLALEGSPLFYAAVLAVLAIGCYAAYRYFRI